MPRSPFNSRIAKGVVRAWVSSPPQGDSEMPGRLAKSRGGVYFRAMPNITITALYKFVALPDYREMQPRLLELCKAQGVMGTLLLAKEGINGTIAGSPQAIETVLQWLESDPRLAGLEHKESFADENPFYRMKVRLKREIVTMGVPDIDPRVTVGTYVEPQDWNALIADPDTVVIDTRNDYEVAIGTFKGAIDPKTTNFREFPAWFEENNASASTTSARSRCSAPAAFAARSRPRC